MAKFPEITTGSLGQIPVSTATNQYDSFLNSVIYNNLSNAQNNGIFVDTIGNLRTGQLFEAETQINEILSSGIIEGMVMSQNQADPTKLDISAGKFHLVLGTSNRLVVDFAGATNVTATNPGSKSMMFVQVNQSSTVSFTEKAEDQNKTICNVGVVRLDGGVDIKDVFNNGDRFENCLTVFADYMNRLGLWYNNLDFKRNTTDGFETSGGNIYSYSGGQTVINKNTTIPLKPINYASVFDIDQTSFTIQYFQNYFPTDDSTVSIDGNNNDYVVWTVHIDSNQKWLLFKPQEAITKGGGDLLSEGMLLMQ